MKTHGEMTLEKHKFFPFVAWTLIILFALFTLNLALNLKKTTDNVSSRTELLEELVNDNSDRLDILEANLNLDKGGTE